MQADDAKAWLRAVSGEPEVRSWLERVVSGVSGPDVTDAALRVAEGRRQLAAQILRIVDNAKKGEF